MAPHRDPGPKASDGPVVWCRERANTKTGVSLFIGVIDSHPFLDPWPLSKFKTRKPTALDLANLVELQGEGGPEVDVFKRASDANPADDDDIIDLNKYGLTMDDPILLVNHHSDAQKIYQMTHAMMGGSKGSSGTDKNGKSGAGKKKNKTKIQETEAEINFCVLVVFIFILILFIILILVLVGLGSPPT
ncbi:hypothetical protein MSAN_00296100 [Mycena sanguinolenta]|uniref:Uncharacterized protein n=1 Tax=Mycena sanguinolenta TaxID=230812 RepID=A0A8H6ZAS7_9AGAR|nr:hypothetical protein MSAN_00296100 [Mycena sanguinolenta]